jgi:copper resistance protein D
VARLYLWSVTLHVLAAVVWLGGMFFLALAAPTIRRHLDPGSRARLFDLLGRMFRRVAWSCIAVLLVTGVIQLEVRGWWGPVLHDPDFWRAPPGRTLLKKLALVAAILAVQAVHDFWAGPSAGRAEPGSEAARVLRSRAAWLARISALLALGVLYYAVRLARGA